MLVKPIRFGVEIIDRKLGGIIPGKNYLIYGRGGTYKTAFGLHFIHEGLSSGHRGVYVTGEDPEALIFQSERLGINLSSYIEDQSLMLLNYHPLLVQKLSRLMDPNQIIVELQRTTANLSPQRIVFDPLENLVEIENRTNLLTYTKLLMESIKNLHSTNLFIIEETGDSNIPYFIKEVSNFSFAVIHLQQENGHRKLTIQKVLWAEREFEDMHYSLKSGQGIVESPVPSSVKEPAVSTLSLNSRDIQSKDATPYVHLVERYPKNRYSLLCVDNDDIFFEMFKDFLKDRFDMELARDSFEAVSKLLSKEYDVILINVNMPKIDGKEIVLRIRENNSIIPIIAFSTHTKRASDIASILRLGADSFVSKAFNFTEVKARIDAVLRRVGTENSYTQAKGLIKEIHEEKKVLQFIPKFDRTTGLNTEEYFEKKISKEIVKAKIGDYNFSIVGVKLIFPNDKKGARKVDSLRVSAMQAIRKDDLVIELTGNMFLFYLDECLKPGVKRFIERLKKNIQMNAALKEIRIIYSVATFPIDGESYEELVKNALDIKDSDKIVSSLKKV